MEITTCIKISEDESDELAKILNCEKEDLSTELQKYSSASLQEYLSMFLGQKVFKRGSDILEYRLFLLIAEAFGNKVPDEQEVCKLFQTTSSESRSLIRSVISKYQYQLKSALSKTISTLLEDANQDDDESPYTATINSQNIVDELNRQLASIDGNLPPVTKKRGSVSIYEIKPSAYNKLKEKFIE